MALSSGNGIFYSAPAAESLASAQYKVGKLNSTGQVAVSAAATTGVGIIQNDAASGETALIQLSGISKAIAGAAIVPEAMLASNTTGQVATTTTANNNVIGLALTPASAAGELIHILIVNSNY